MQVVLQMHFGLEDVDHSRVCKLVTVDLSRKSYIVTCWRHKLVDVRCDCLSSSKHVVTHITTKSLAQQSNLIPVAWACARTNQLGSTASFETCLTVRRALAHRGVRLRLACPGHIWKTAVYLNCKFWCLHEHHQLLILLSMCGITMHTDRSVMNLYVIQVPWRILCALHFSWSWWHSWSSVPSRWPTRVVSIRRYLMCMKNRTHTHKGHVDWDKRMDLYGDKQSINPLGNPCMVRKVIQILQGVHKKESRVCHDWPNLQS